MKSRLFISRCLALTVAGLMCFFHASAADGSGMVGDLNGDGRLSITDVTCLINDALYDGPVPPLAKIGNAFNDLVHRHIIIINWAATTLRNIVRG